MPLPLAGKLAIGTAYLFKDLVTQPIDAALTPRKIAHTQRALFLDPLILPDVAVVIDLLNRQMIDPDLANGLLRNHGVTLWGLDGDEHDDEYYRSARAAWRQVVNLSKEIPSIREVMDWHVRGFIKEIPARRMVTRAGGHPDWWFQWVDEMRERPGVADVLDAYLRDRIKRPEAEKLFQEAGTRIELWETMVQARSAVFGPRELIELANRDLIKPPDFEQRLRYLGYQDPYEWKLWTELRKGLPGVADLNMFGIRHSWQPELVERYGYYLEFPERLREWYGKLGLNYPIGFQAQTDQGVRDLMLSDAYWAAHWHVLPLNSAFMAYQRFQPDLVGRFQVDNPNLQAFTREDLNIHMRQADFPPGVREWLTALAHPVLGRRDINWGAQFLGWDRAEMQSRYRLLGYTTDDAASLARIAENRETYRSQAWLRSIETRAHQQTVRMIEGLYTDGTIDRSFALRQLSDAGLSEGLSIQLLDIADFGVERKLVSASVSATGRDYLSGVLSRPEAETQLRRIGIQDARVANYLAAWGIRRSAHRKRIETAKVAGMVTAGLMSADEARARLANLQWSDPDATLLLAEAEGKLAKRLAAEQKSAETSARQRAKELERLAKDADAQSRKLRTEANRIAPRSALTTWLKDSIIDDDTFRSMMRDRGYDDVDIERYLKDAKTPKPRPPRPSPTTPPWPKPAGSAHPMQAKLAKWLKDEIITIQDYADGLTDLGYNDSDVARFVRDAGGAATNPAVPPSNGQAPAAP